MANTKNAKKATRKSAKRRLLNRYQAKTTRNAIRNFKALEDKDKSIENLSNVISLIDKLAKKNVIHKNKAANLKSKLQKSLNK
ncbi:MAG: 30S ribosomal protein S20 [Chitinophagales bacterium]|jgi:small subunit ribosomal protein S20|nr:30S ribosomal protein S20 [Chitinophagales bacterium]